MAPCSNCNTDFDGTYCYNCGQKRYTDNDKSVKHLLEEAFHFITHFEGTFLKTLKAVTFSPGKLSADFARGKRKPYFKPVSFYLLIVVIYLLFPIASGLHMEMGFYKRMPVVGNLIARQVEHKSITKDISEEHLSEVFKEKSHGTSKVLLFLFIPLSALVIYLLYCKAKSVWYDKLILATEMNIVYLTLFYLILPAIYFILIKSGMLPYADDEVVGIINTLLFALYVSLIFYRTFQSSKIASFFKGVAFALMHSFIIVKIFNFLVFEFTIAMI